MKEEQVDRRAHWVQIAITGIVLATGWCVKLEMNLSKITDDFVQYKKDMKSTSKEFDNKLYDHNDRLIHLEDWRDVSQTHGGHR
jgi:hypothetical protein